MSREEEILDGLYDHTIDGERKEVAALTDEALAFGTDPLVILFDALIPALEEVGRLFEEGTFFVPEMLVAAKAMQGAMDILRPRWHTPPSAGRHKNNLKTTHLYEPGLCQEMPIISFRTRTRALALGA